MNKSQHCSLQRLRRLASTLTQQIYYKADPIYYIKTYISDQGTCPREGQRDVGIKVELVGKVSKLLLLFLDTLHESLHLLLRRDNT